MMTSIFFDSYNAYLFKNYMQPFVDFFWIDVRFYGEIRVSATSFSIRRSKCRHMFFSIKSNDCISQSTVITTWT